jgi:exonuclease SbcD
LASHDRTEELFGQAERVCRLAEERDTDVLLVAGDVFERRALPGLTKRLAGILAPLVRRGTHIVLVPGNHDDREHFRMMDALLTLEHGQSERVHVVQTRQILTIEGVQFAIVPYPVREILASHLPETAGTTPRNVALSTAYAEVVRAVVGDLDPSLPAIFVAHVNVAGVTTPSDHELTYDDDIRLGRADLPLAANLAYIALGHIHQPQEIPHPVPCRYSGSIDRLNLGERKDDKCVFLVDVPEAGLAIVESLPLETTPFYDLRLPAAELETLAGYRDIERAFARVHVETRAGDDPTSLQRRVREICSRCLNVTFSGEGLASTGSGSSLANSRDYARTALGHLREIYANDPDLPELERRANVLLREVSDALATD